MGVECQSFYFILVTLSLIKNQYRDIAGSHVGRFGLALPLSGHSQKLWFSAAQRRETSLHGAEGTSGRGGHP